MNYLTYFVVIFALAVNYSEGIRRNRRTPQLGEFNENLKPREAFKIIGTSEDFKTGFVAISGRNSARGVNFDDNKDLTAAEPLIEKKPIWVIPYVPSSGHASLSRANAGRSRNADGSSELETETTTIGVAPAENDDADNGLVTEYSTILPNDAPSVD